MALIGEGYRANLVSWRLGEGQFAPIQLRFHKGETLSDEQLTQPNHGFPAQPRVLAGRYDVIEVVGSGASAVTWRGHDRRLDRQVAIKILRRDLEQDEAYVQRFEREARTSASVSHGNVVNVYDVGQQDGWLYLVMQLINGEDLKHAIGRRGPLPAEDARDITRQILNGLGAIHRAGILHRDIKPQNVLIGGNDVVRVTDFGIAQSAVDIGLTSAGTTLGTAAYMAPEQAKAGTLSDATDLYGVGVVLYEMLTGVLPFEKPTATATMLAHIQELPIPPSRRFPHLAIPPLLDGIVLQAMAKNPESRFQSAAAMVRALEGDLRDPGATTRFVAAPGRTQLASVVPARNQAWPAASPAPSIAPPRGRPTPGPSGSGSRILLTVMLVLILLAMAVVAGYVYYEYTTDDNGPGSAGENQRVTPPTDPLPAIEPPPTIEPSPTDLPVIVPPSDEPEREPTPAIVRDIEATNVPIESVDQVIEPESSPISD